MNIRLANAKFALGVDPRNGILRERAGHVAKLRAAGEYTLPTTIVLECATNPFLRAEEPEVQAAVGMPDADPARGLRRIARPQEPRMSEGGAVSRSRSRSEARPRSSACSI